MNPLDIVTYPSEVLATPAAPVTEIGEDIRDLFDRMIDTMYEENGIGVAAPQVGHGIRAIVIDADMENRGSRILKLVNPRFSAMEGDIIWAEGCLSIPGLVLDIKRKERVQVDALDEHGNEVSIEGEGLLAVAFQHELDHLDGTVILDRVSRLKRDFYRRKIAKHGYPVEMPGESDDAESDSDSAAIG